MCFPCITKYGCWQSKTIKRNEISPHEKGILPLLSDTLPQFVLKRVQVAPYQQCECAFIVSTDYILRVMGYWHLEFNTLKSTEEP